MRASAASNHRTLLSVREYYRRQGYDVTVTPKRDQLPAFLKGFRPDLIVRRGNEKRLVIVKQRSDVQKVRPMEASVLERLESHPDWTLEYHYVRGQGDVVEPVSVTESLTRQQIAKRATEARKLLTEGHTEAALVLVWSALEAVIRGAATRKRLLVRGGAEAMSSALVADGFLSHEHHRLVQAAVPIRNAYVHGFRSSELDRDLVVKLIGALPEIQRELNPKRQSRAS